MKGSELTEIYREFTNKRNQIENLEQAKFTITKRIEIIRNEQDKTINKLFHRLFKWKD